METPSSPADGTKRAPDSPPTKGSAKPEKLGGRRCEEASIAQWTTPGWALGAWSRSGVIQCHGTRSGARRQKGNLDHRHELAWTAD